MVRRTKVKLGHILANLWHGGRGWMLLIISLGWFFSIGIRFSYPTLLPYFQKTFTISFSMAGLLVSFLWVAYALGQFPGGALADRFGEGNILVVSTILSVIGLFVVAVSNSFYILFAGTIAFGAATALYGPTRYTIIPDIYSEHSGTAIGFTMAAGSIGNTLLPIFAAMVASYASWRVGFSALIPVFIGISTALWFLVPSRTSPPIETESFLSVETILRVVRSIKRNGIPVVLLAHILGSFVSQGFLAFYPIYLIEVKGFSPATAATLYGLYFAIGVIVQPLAGTSNDHFGVRTTLTLLLGTYFVSLLLLPFIHGVIAIGLLTVTLSSRNGIGAVTNTFITTTLPSDIKGTGLGLLRMMWILIGATSPLFVGLLADAKYLEEAFFLLALLAGVATALVVFFSD